MVKERIFLPIAFAIFLTTCELNMLTNLAIVTLTCMVDGKMSRPSMIDTVAAQGPMTSREDSDNIFGGVTFVDFEDYPGFGTKRWPPPPSADDFVIWKPVNQADDSVTWKPVNQPEDAVTWKPVNRLEELVLGWPLKPTLLPRSRPVTWKPVNQPDDAVTWKPVNQPDDAVTWKPVNSDEPTDFDGEFPYATRRGPPPPSTEDDAVTWKPVNQPDDAVTWKPVNKPGDAVTWKPVNSDEPSDFDGEFPYVTRRGPPPPSTEDDAVTWKPVNQPEDAVTWKPVNHLEELVLGWPLKPTLLPRSRLVTWKPVNQPDDAVTWKPVNSLRLRRNMMQAAA